MRNLICALLVLAGALALPAHAAVRVATPLSVKADIAALSVCDPTGAPNELVIASSFTLPRIDNVSPACPLTVRVNAGVRSGMAAAWVRPKKLTFTGAGEWGYLSTLAAQDIAVQNTRVAGPGVSQQANILIGSYAGVRSQRIRIENVDFVGTWKGVGFAGVDDGQIVGNRFVGTISDAINVANAQRVRVEGNDAKNFAAPNYGDHPDCIQVFTSAGLGPTTGIVIRYNKCSGQYAQGIFVQNPGAAYLANITIEGNTVEAGQVRGVSLDTTAQASVVRSNTVSTWSTETRWQSSIFAGGAGITRSCNTVAAHLQWPAVVDPC